ncbi:MAG TPA: benenodin family lasso peptide [Sphingomonas sp.]|jgi:hypothetical protein|nr:benenodin family lasso peptide [Sphingomonas sp.]
MERDLQQAELIDLGAASTETQGPPDNQIELSAFTRVVGISDDD